jgi:hypothetical protein
MPELSAVDPDMLSVGSTSIETVPDVESPALLACTVKLLVPAVVGVPEITPPEDRLRPPGALPLSSDHV